MKRQARNIGFQLQATLQRNTPERETPERDEVDVLLDELVNYFFGEEAKFLVSKKLYYEVCYENSFSNF